MSEQPALSGILMKTPSSTHAEGGTVVANIGNLELRMPYRDAFLLSQWLRMSAKEAKANAGDTGRHWSVLGILDDARAARR